MCVSETANYRYLLMRDNMYGKSSYNIQLLSHTMKNNMEGS